MENTNDVSADKIIFSPNSFQTGRPSLMSKMSTEDLELQDITKKREEKAMKK